MKRIEKIHADSPQLADLLAQSDAHFAALYPPESNHLEDKAALSQPHVSIYGVWVEDSLVACGAVKIMKDEGIYGEIKRLFVLPAWRKHGLARLVMAKLHAHLIAQGVFIARLETGINEADIVRFYLGLGYEERPAFGPYHSDPLSIFMEKSLKNL